MLVRVAHTTATAALLDASSPSRLRTLGRTQLQQMGYQRVEMRPQPNVALK